LKTKIVCTPVPCNAVSRRFRGSAKQQTALIERLTAGETNSDESLRVLLRLFIDEIVEALSRRASGCESRPVQKPSPSMDAVVVLG
jgi:hypothetical protein